MSHIFISYSRKDVDFAQKIVDALAANNLDTWIDWKSIPKGEDWEQEIYRGIEEADAFLFLISPDSVASQMCNKEIAHAVKNGKRILPIVIRDADPKNIHLEISKRNWIFCRDGQDDFNKAIEETRQTIHTDYKWLKYHTELQVKALKWEQKKDASRLLRGKELREAEKQLAIIIGKEDPQPTKLQREYILASRRNEERQRRQITLSLGFGLIIMAILAVFAWVQRNEAISNAKISRIGQLVAIAKSVYTDHAQRSLLLNVEAANISNDIGSAGKTSIEDAMRRSLLTIGGIPLFRCQGPITKSAISPNYRWVASGNEAGEICVWDFISSAQLPIVLHGHTNRINSIVFSADEKWMVTSSSDNTVRLWELENLSKKSTVINGSGEQVFISSNSRWLIITHPISAELWDLTNISATEPVLEFQAYYTIPSVAFSPTTNQLFVSNDSSIETLDLNTLRPVPHDRPCHLCADLTISPDGHWLAARGGGTTGYMIGSASFPSVTLYLWDLTSSNSEPMVIGSSDGLIAFSPNSKWLASNIEDAISVWYLPSLAFNIEPAVYRFGSNTAALAITNDGDLVIGSTDNTVKFSFARPRHIVLYGHESPVLGAFVDPIKNQLITISQDGEARLWNINSPIVTTVDLEPEDLPMESFFVFSPDNNWLFTANDDSTSISRIDLKHLGSKAIAQEFSHLEDKIYDLIVGADSHWLIGFTSETVYGWDLFKNSDIPIVEYPTSFFGHPTISWDGHWLATYSTNTDADTSIYIWDLLNFIQKPQIINTNLNHLLDGSIFSSDNRWLVVKAPDENAQIYMWDMEHLSSYPIQPLKNYKVLETAISVDGGWVASRVETGDTSPNISLYLWDITTDFSNPYVLPDCNCIGGNFVVIPEQHRLITYSKFGDDATAWDLDNPASGPISLYEYSHRDSFSGRIPRSYTVIAISRDKRWLAIRDDHESNIRLWDLYSPELIPILIPVPSSKEFTMSLFFSPENKWLAMDKQILDLNLNRNMDELRKLDCDIVGRNFTQAEWQQYFPDESYRITCPQWPAGE